jgi:hypothetical protein
MEYLHCTEAINVTCIILQKSSKSKKQKWFFFSLFTDVHGGINLLYIQRPDANIYSEITRVTPQKRLLFCIYVVVIMQSHCCIVGCGWVFCADPSNFR